MARCQLLNSRKGMPCQVRITTTMRSLRPGGRCCAAQQERARPGSPRPRCPGLARPRSPRGVPGGRPPVPARRSRRRNRPARRTGTRPATRSTASRSSCTYATPRPVRSTYSAAPASSGCTTEISQDPVADSTDLYAFVSPDRPGTVTLIANYIPLESPAGGPNFYEFGNDVLYEIHVDNDGDGLAEITYQFRFHTKLTTPGSFLYNTGPIRSLGDPSWNSKQFYSVTRVDRHGSRLLGRNLPCPPCNVGILSTPHYEARLGSKAVNTLANGMKGFAGQRAEEFYVDLGSIFDLANLRPFQQL